MSHDPDEELIEATIRRVAQAKAAREAAEGSEGPQARATASAEDAPQDESEAEPESEPAAQDEPAGEAAPAPAAVDEDLIEATIRRVADAKAAREAAEGSEGPQARATAPAEDAPQDESDAEPESEPAAQDEPAGEAAPAPAAVDEDLIEATIRRVAAERAAKEAEAARQQSDPPAAEPAAAVIRPLPAVGPEPAPASAEPGSDGRWASELRTLRQEVEALKGMVRELEARVDAALATGDVPLQPPRPADDGWDETPTIPRIPLGQPLRPAIFRDPSPRTATAEQLMEQEPDEVVIDTRPIPRPLPPLHAEPKRGLDLLPRMYRLTVEDKRRGVDLVPLHRALLGMDGVRDMSLLSYSNGVAIISIEMAHELDPDVLEQAVARAMSRAAKVEVHNDTTMVVKLAEE